MFHEVIIPVHPTGAEVATVTVDLGQTVEAFFVQEVSRGQKLGRVEGGWEFASIAVPHIEQCIGPAECIIYIQSFRAGETDTQKNIYLSLFGTILIQLSSFFSFQSS